MKKENHKLYSFYTKYNSTFTKKLISILKADAPFPKIELQEVAIPHKEHNNDIQDNVIMFNFKNILPLEVHRKFYFSAKIEYGKETYEFQTSYCDSNGLYNQ